MAEFRTIETMREARKSFIVRHPYRLLRTLLRRVSGTPEENGKGTEEAQTERREYGGVDSQPSWGGYRQVKACGSRGR